MPINFSKEEVATLSDEQLDAYARVHLESERARRELCDMASGRNRSLVLPVLAGVAGLVVVVWFPGILRDSAALIVLAITLLFGSHWRTNRRMDALVRLLDIDHLERNPSAENDAPSNGGQRSE